MTDAVPWELGGEYHWSGFPSGPFLPWPGPRAWFPLGHETVLALWRGLSGADREPALWVPDFFCPEVTGSWTESGMTLRLYADDPRWPAPDWETLAPEPDDLVLAVNHFGVRDPDPWRTWQRAHRSVVLIEDHSHDPLSSWARMSQADYAFASLRKTSPVPDGALLWSPRGRAIPSEPGRKEWTGSALKLSAMVWKAEYLGGVGGTASKETFRSFQLTGERSLFETRGAAISPWSRALLEPGYPIEWRGRRESNVRAFLDRWHGDGTVLPLFTGWPEGHCPFNPILVFASMARREEFRAALIESGIYAPVHWAPLPGASERATDLAGRILTLPLDQRYGLDDVSRVISILDEIRGSRT